MRFKVSPGTSIVSDVMIRNSTVIFDPATAAAAAPLSHLYFALARWSVLRL